MDEIAKNKAKERKETPIFSGALMYFPKAIADVSRCSFKANEQHNPGTPMHWDREKSKDELDALVRHLMDVGKIDSDGIRHSAKVAWRALANLEKEIELDETCEQCLEDVYNGEVAITYKKRDCKKHLTIKN